MVDYNRAVADSLALVFGRLGFEKMTAYSGETALLVAASPPDAAIIEMILADLNGLQTANTLRDLYPDCRIILIYSQVADHFLQTAGDYPTFRKPVNPVLLSETLDMES